MQYSAALVEFAPALNDEAISRAEYLRIEAEIKQEEVSEVIAVSRRLLEQSRQLMARGL
jgi:hypothetical protein